MKLTQLIIAFTTLLPCVSSAQTLADFEGNDNITKVEIYDSWENSPFRNGQLKGNVVTASNPLRSQDNPSKNVLAMQRSRYGSNVFGARIYLAAPIMPAPEGMTISVKIYKPRSGRTMLIGIGRRVERAAQKEIEQFNILSDSIAGGAWQTVTFKARCAKGVAINSLVVVPHCEPPHTFGEHDFAVYIDDIEIK